MYLLFFLSLLLSASIFHNSLYGASFDDRIYKKTPTLPANEGNTQDNKAEAILGHISQLVRSYKTLRILFSLDLEVQSRKARLKGRKQGIFLMKEKKYFIQLEDQEIYFNGNTLWVYDKKNNEVQITRPDPKQTQNNTFSPQLLFSNMDFYKKDFRYRLNEQKTLPAGKRFKEIELVPVDKTKTFTKILLYVSNKHRLQKIIIFDRNSSKYTYTLQKITTNAVAEDAAFNFPQDKYPDAEVIDLR